MATPTDDQVHGLFGKFEKNTIHHFGEVSLQKGNKEKGVRNVLSALCM
jgi:hypothetical protein